MTTLRVACIQTTSSNNLEDNCTMAQAFIREAATQGAQLIVLPENIFMLRASDTDLLQPIPEHEHQGILMTQRLAQELGVWILLGSVHIPSGTFCADGKPKFFNRSIFINPQGDITARYDKIHLFDAMINDGVRYLESSRIDAGNQVIVAATPWGGLGLSICYDVRFPHLHREMAQVGAAMIAIPAAFAEYTGRSHWHIMVRARAIETGCFVFAPGQCGTHNGGRRTYGHSLIVSPWGEIIAEADATTQGVITADIDLQQVEEIRNRLPSLYHERHDIVSPEYNI
jgi:predicted amidohydrolase